MVLLNNGKVIVWGNNEFGLSGKSRFVKILLKYLIGNVLENQENLFH